VMFNCSTRFAEACRLSPHSDPRWLIFRASILLRNELSRRAVGSVAGFSLAGRQYRFGASAT
jgi:hypothetical protein